MGSGVEGPRPDTSTASARACGDKERPDGKGGHKGALPPRVLEDRTSPPPPPTWPQQRQLGMGKKGRMGHRQIPRRGSTHGQLMGRNGARQSPSKRNGRIRPPTVGCSKAGSPSLDANPRPLTRRHGRHQGMPRAPPRRTEPFGPEHVRKRGHRQATDSREPPSTRYQESSKAVQETQLQPKGDWAENHGTPAAGHRTGQRKPAIHRKCNEGTSPCDPRGAVRYFPAFTEETDDATRKESRDSLQLSWGEG